jgi:hypothetical protein
MQEVIVATAVIWTIDFVAHIAGYLNAFGQTVVGQLGILVSLAFLISGMLLWRHFNLEGRLARKGLYIWIRRALVPGTEFKGSVTTIVLVGVICCALIELISLVAPGPFTEVIMFLIGCVILRTIYLAYRSNREEN